MGLLIGNTYGPLSPPGFTPKCRARSIQPLKTIRCGPPKITNKNRYGNVCLSIIYCLCNVCNDENMDHLFKIGHKGQICVSYFSANILIFTWLDLAELLWLLICVLVLELLNFYNSQCFFTWAKKTVPRTRGLTQVIEYMPTIWLH